ncbi:MAG: hypothetical protein ACOZAQ_10635 [Pseudomonadota bacterium]
MMESKRSRLAKVGWPVFLAVLMAASAALTLWQEWKAPAHPLAAQTSQVKPLPPAADASAPYNTGYEPILPMPEPLQATAPSSEIDAHALFARAMRIFECERLIKTGSPFEDGQQLPSGDEDLPPEARKWAENMSAAIAKRRALAAECAKFSEDDLLQAEEYVKKAAAQGDRDAKKYLLERRLAALLDDAEKKMADAAQYGFQRDLVLAVDETEVRAIYDEVEALAMGGHRPSIALLGHFKLVNAPSLQNPARSAAWQIVASIPPGESMPPPEELARANDGLLENMSGDQAQEALQLASDIFARCCAPGARTSSASGSNP